MRLELKSILQFGRSFFGKNSAKGTSPVLENCHLWNADKLTAEEISASLELLEEYLDDSDLIRRLYRCKKCKQLYFYEFKEDLNWETGAEPQYRTWIPVNNEAHALLLNKESSMSLLKYPSIREDFPAHADKPGDPYHVGRKKPSAEINTGTSE